MPEALRQTFSQQRRCFRLLIFFFFLNSLSNYMVKHQIVLELLVWPIGTVRSVIALSTCAPDVWLVNSPLGPGQTGQVRDAEGSGRTPAHARPVEGDSTPQFRREGHHPILLAAPNGRVSRVGPRRRPTLPQIFRSPRPPLPQSQTARTRRTGSSHSARVQCPVHNCPPGPNSRRRRGRDG